MRRFVRPTLFSIFLHASAIGGLYWMPLSLIERFDTAGSRNVISIEISLANASAPISLPMVIETADAILPEPQQASPIERPDRSTNHPSTASDLSTLKPAIELPDFDPELDVTLSRRVTEAIEMRSVEDPTEIRPRRTTYSQSTPPTVNLVPLELEAGLSEKIAADLSSNPPPNYPIEAVRARSEGTVLLRLHVDDKGHVTSTEVIESSGYTSLDRAATDAVSRWRGQPAQRFGRAIASQEVIPIRFRL